MNELSKPTSPKFIDRTGHQYGSWKVEEYAGKNWRGDVIWQCLCACGTRKTLVGNSLSKQVGSCGCQKGPKLSALRRTHGLTGTTEYNVWLGMKARCESPGSPVYARYGERGIQVCERWRSSFEAFLADMGNRPSPKHSLDRIDVNGNYEPSNCRWATQAVQQRNRRNNVVVTVDGITACLAEHCERYGIKQPTLSVRIHKKGWSVERALKTPVRGAL